MNDILILSHAHDAVNPDSNYTINLMARLFAGSGLKVAYQKGLARQPQARAVINQVDLTTTPEAYIQYFKEFPVAINGRLTQISKAVVCQDTLVRLGDGYGGPVIVKTSLNCGGFPELAMMVETGSIEPGVRLRRTWRDLQVIDPLNYPIYASPDLVPEGVWENPRLVVQRLRTERDDQGLYCLRSWYVLGDRGFHVMTKSREPIVRGSGIIHREVLEVVTPPGLAAVRSRLGVDFGRFDYVLADGEAIVFDVNRTPTSSLGAIEQYQPQWRDMAQGISSYLNPPGT